MDGFNSSLDLMTYFDVDFRDLKYATSNILTRDVGLHPVDEFIESLSKFGEGDSNARYLE